MLFGFGLFYVDKETKRKWLYPLILSYAVLDLILASYQVEPFRSTEFGGYTFITALGIYILSFIDVIVACRKARR